MHKLLSFLDAYLGYNQIPIFPLDSANMAFITLIGMYCYNVMPFGHKNAGTTYQHMMSRLFEPLLGKSMEAYIDDMLGQIKILQRSSNSIARGISTHETTPPTVEPQ